jgi:hypothetical protein
MELMAVSFTGKGAFVKEEEEEKKEEEEVSG